jgi:hypothetical protein
MQLREIIDVGGVMMADDMDLEFACSQRDDAIRDAEKLANALRDIYNEIGEVSQVRLAYDPVEDLVSEYAGMESW